MPNFEPLWGPPRCAKAQKIPEMGELRKRHHDDSPSTSEHATFPQKKLEYVEVEDKSVFVVRNLDLSHLTNDG